MFGDRKQTKNAERPRVVRPNFRVHAYLAAPPLHANSPVTRVGTLNDTSDYILLFENRLQCDEIRFVNV